MKEISSASQGVLKILDRFNILATDYHLSIYCVHVEIDDGILLFNILTRELLLLSPDEFANLFDIDYLKKHFFIISNDINEKDLASICKRALLSQRKDLSCITTYTIFPTTDCNARCFYCFEKGRSVSTMSINTAYKIVDYIDSHCCGKLVSFRWFGGEPLLNSSVIDVICNGLRSKGILFRSSMVSNGYLFSDEIIERAKNSWNLESVQITLDGTEHVYNRVKAYKNTIGSAYDVVLTNIKKLTDASIKVQIRMNMDLYNADDLLNLSKYLTDRFSGNKYLSAYAHHIFQDGVAMGDMHSPEEWAKRDAAISEIESVLSNAGMYKLKSLSTKPRIAHCMADSGSAITILPDGHIGLCEHYSDSEFIGHIDSDVLDKIGILGWRKTVPEISECNDCFYYPECIMLKKCTNSTVCYPQLRASHLRKTKEKMCQLYDKWKAKID